MGSTNPLLKRKAANQKFADAQVTKELSPTATKDKSKNGISKIWFGIFLFLCVGTLFFEALRMFL